MVGALLVSGCGALGSSSDGERPRYPGPQWEWELKKGAVETLSEEATLEIRELAVDRSRQPTGVIPRSGDELLVVFGNPRKLARTHWQPGGVTTFTAFSDVTTTLVRPYKSALYAATEHGIAVLGADGGVKRLIPFFDTLADFAPLDDDQIAVSPLFSGRSGPFIKVIDQTGIGRGEWVASRSNLKDIQSPLRGIASVVPCGDKVVVVAEHEPLFAVIERDLSGATEVPIDFPRAGELLQLARKPEATSPAEGVKWLPAFTVGVACYEYRAFVLLALPRPVLLEFDLEGNLRGRYVGPPQKTYRHVRKLVANAEGQFFAIALGNDERAFVLELSRKSGAGDAELVETR